ncbi:MAG: response regulator [Bacteroidales bacterium]|nr:response regulator [Bacteroidales bacterium]
MNTKNITPKSIILLAEGFPAGRKIMEEILSILGYNYKTVDTGYEVIMALKSEKFDLILLDLELPQFDGFETIEHIRRNFNYPENTIPVIAMSNKDFSSDFNQTYKEEGFDGLIVKPFSLDELDTIIKEVLFRFNKSEKTVFSD